MLMEVEVGPPGLVCFAGKRQDKVNLLELQYAES